MDTPVPIDPEPERPESPGRWAAREVAVPLSVALITGAVALGGIAIQTHEILCEPKVVQTTVRKRIGDMTSSETTTTQRTSCAGRTHAGARPKPWKP
jgi:hypothetical protein